MPIVYLSRRESFSAAHRLNSLHLTAEENAAVFGKCNRENGHGHNYTMEVIVKGEVDPHTGMVMNITELKQLIKDKVLDVLDHRNLDKDVEYFQHRPSSVENIAIFIWEALSTTRVKHMLHEIKVQETDKNHATYRGE